MKLNASKNSKRSIAWLILFLLAAVVAGYFANQSSSVVQTQGSYLVGQVANKEIFAPKKITVVDPVATQARRQKELEKVPAIFRFNPNAADEAVARFTADFVGSREAFLDAVEKAFNKRTLATNQIAGIRFREVFTAFKTTHQTFPATSGQALKWAQGNKQEPLQTDFRASLRSVAGKFIRSDEWPVSAESGPIRFVTQSSKVMNAKLPERSQSVKRADVIGLAKARKELATSFRPSDRVVSDVLTNFVQINFIFDEELTAQLRAEKTNGIWAVATYQPGQVIIQRGQIIDAKIKAALDEFGSLPTVTNPFSEKQGWLWATAILCGALALWCGLRIVFGRRSTALVPVGNVLTLPTNEKENLQAQLMPHLARGLMSRLVRGLISQRAEVIQTQNLGTEQLNELEQRLAKINTRLQTRQASYEQRIAELEKELAAAEDENRELIRAKIHEARQNLEWAKAQNH